MESQLPHLEMAPAIQFVITMPSMSAVFVVIESVQPYLQARVGWSLERNLGEQSHQVTPFYRGHIPNGN